MNTEVVLLVGNII